MPTLLNMFGIDIPDEVRGHSLMLTHMREFFDASEFIGARLSDPFDFTKGMPTLRLPARFEADRPPAFGGVYDAETVLYDLEADPEQLHPLDCGYFLPEEAPEETLQEILSFLSEE